nr:MAG: hypothetical protein [Chemarfal virus 264]
MQETGYSPGVPPKLWNRFQILSNQDSAVLPILEDCVCSKTLESCTCSLAQCEAITQITSGGNLTSVNLQLHQPSTLSTTTTSVGQSDTYLKNLIPKSWTAKTLQKNKLSTAKSSINAGFDDSAVVPPWLSAGSSTLDNMEQPLDSILPKGVQTKLLLWERCFETVLTSMDQGNLKQMISMLRFLDETPYCSLCMTPVIVNPRWYDDEVSFRCNECEYTHVIKKNGFYI